MERLSATDLRKGLMEVVYRVALKKECFVLEIRGKDMAALIPLQDFRRFQEFEQQMLRREFEEAKHELKKARESGKRYSWADLKTVDLPKPPEE